MSILINNETRVIVQGITGAEASEVTMRMMKYGTQVVGGVTPGKGGEWYAGLPIFDTVKAAVNATGANTSLVYVPPIYAADSIYEAIESGIELIVSITEGIPVWDMMQLYAYIRRTSSRLIGPNCPGILAPGYGTIGIIPFDSIIRGNVGIVSTSGTLLYEVLLLISNAGYGISTAMGIGNDPICGTTFIDSLELFENDPDTEKIILIGEIGGLGEVNSAEYIKKHITKPVISYIVGKTAPFNVQMGHRGAVITNTQETAQYKVAALRSAGVRVADIPSQIPQLLMISQ